MIQIIVARSLLETGVEQFGAKLRARLCLGSQRVMLAGISVRRRHLSGQLE